MAYLQPLQLEMDVADAMRGVPIIAIMLVPPNISRVVVTFQNSRRDRIAAVESSRSPTRTTQARDGDNERVPDRLSKPYTQEMKAVASTKCPDEVESTAVTAEGSSTRARAEAGPSSVEAIEKAVAGTKRPYEVNSSTVTAEGPSTRARTEAGPSSVKVTGKPQYVPGNDNEVLVVLPPIPKSLYEELADDSLTEPESTDDEREIRKIELKSSD